MRKNLTWLICGTCISVENRRLFIITSVDVSPLVWGGNMQDLFIYKGMFLLKEYF